jgi:predicted double-glycine peptidase
MTPSATLPLVAAKPKEAPKPRPSRTEYRPASGQAFSDALRSASAQATLAQSQTSPSAARIAAPPSDDGGREAASPMESLPSQQADPRLWESLIRSPGLPLAITPQVGAASDDGAMVSMAARSAPFSPNTQAISPAAARERGQAFLRSIKGFDQTKTDEYDSPAQARAWGYSTCSAASLTAVLRAAGQDVRIADVMKAMPGGMTIQLGLVSRPSLVNAANQFGARATDDVTGYDALDQATEKGQPVLVDIRNGKFPEGHWIVVTGVDENGVQVADSSRYDMTSIPRGEFMRSWSGRGIRLEGLTPGSQSTRANTQSA